MISVFLERMMRLYLMQLSYKDYLPTDLLATNDHPNAYTFLSLFYFDTTYHSFF